MLNVNIKNKFCKKRQTCTGGRPVKDRDLGKDVFDERQTSHIF